MAECILCDDLASAGEIVFSSVVADVLLHPDSAVRGHAMVVAKRHVENIADLSDDEARDLALVQRAAERALLEVTGADRAILLKLGIQVPHLHIHIYPVPDTMTRAGVMNVIDAKVSEVREPGFAAAVREKLEALTPPAS